MRAVPATWIIMMTVRGGYGRHPTGKPVIKWSSAHQHWYPTAYIAEDWWDFRKVEQLRPYVVRLNLANGKPV